METDRQRERYPDRESNREEEAYSVFLCFQVGEGGREILVTCITGITGILQYIIWQPE